GMQPAEHHWDFGDGTFDEGLRQHHAFKQAGTYVVRLDVIAEPDSAGRINNTCNTKTIVVIDRFRDQEDMAVVATYQDAFGNTHTFEYQELPFDIASMENMTLNDVVFNVQLFASKQRVDLDDPKFAEVRKLYRVIERYDPATAMYTYSVGEAKSMAELFEVFRKVKELQFLDAEVFAIHEERVMDLSKLDLSSLENLNHTKLRTNAIHFAFKSAQLEPGSEAVLGQIIDLMRQHPELELVIEAHTDDIGSRASNITLSQERAMSVVSYLVDHGIPDNKLVPVGHGKNQPIASNKTEEGRAQNRRVEFRVSIPNAEVEAPSNLTHAMPGKR
ncbi:MAG TPA: OmpA family protein, partial [Flavobacteriales bacterium]|nr:OmpA family protein [Flavobacteriales bacterium]